MPTEWDLYELLRECSWERAIIIKEATSDWAENDDEFANERYDGKYDFDRIKEMVHLDETALAQWYKVREDIALSLPKEKQNHIEKLQNKFMLVFTKTWLN